MFSEASVLYEMAEDGLETYSLSERARRYEREKQSGATTLSYEDWCFQVWYVRLKERQNL
jgi:hypothetical protein